MAEPPDGVFLPPVDLDPEVEITPYALFRRLQGGEPPLLIDIRSAPSGLTFRGAVARSRTECGPSWRPPGEGTVILFDDEGTGAREIARRLRSEGHEALSLFGGLRLYDAALDPAVVGEERYLVEVGVGLG